MLGVSHPDIVRPSIREEKSVKASEHFSWSHSPLLIYLKTAVISVLCCFFFFLLGSHVCIYCMIICFLFLLCRLIFQIGLKWNFTEITFSKSPIGGSCLWKDRMSWKLDCGLNSNQRKVLTMGAWPENGSSCCPKRCSTPTTVSLSTPQRKSQVTWRALRMGPRRNSFSLKELKRDEKIAAQAFEMR